MEIKKVRFPTHKNETGALSFLEAEGHIPFPIRRVYYIYDVTEGARRGFHAHKALCQALFCVGGSCRILLDDGTERETVTLDNPSEALLIERPIWREMYDFSPGAVLMVMASEHYDEADYIRSYDQFLAYLEENKE